MVTTASYNWHDQDGPDHPGRPALTGMGWHVARIPPSTPQWESVVADGSPPTIRPSSFRLSYFRTVAIGNITRGRNLQHLVLTGRRVDGMVWQ